MNQGASARMTAPLAGHSRSMVLLGIAVQAATALVRCLFGHDPVSAGDCIICRRCYRRLPS